MMIIKPIELANVCAIFPSLRTPRISVDDLIKLVQDTKLIDSDNPAQDLLIECIDSGLLTEIDNKYCLTTKGRQLTKKHSRPGYELNKNACDVFIKQILFDLRVDKWCCGDFINQFEVDTILETFVYHRDKKFRDDTRWMIILDNVGLIEVDINKAYIRHEYLGLINEFLLHTRNPTHSVIRASENRRKEIGDLAEILAIQYEQERLTTAGFPILAILVEHISRIDQSAGYDIRSFCGDNPNPDENIYIEVKGTSMSDFSFTWSFNEINTAKSKTDNYWIYGYTDVDITQKVGCGPIKIRNPILNLESLGYASIPLDHFVTQR